MLRAETAYRAALKAETISDLLTDFAASVDPRIAVLGQAWVSQNLRNVSR